MQWHHIRYSLCGFTVDTPSASLSGLHSKASFFFQRSLICASYPTRAGESVCPIFTIWISSISISSGDQEHWSDIGHSGSYRSLSLSPSSIDTTRNTKALFMRAFYAPSDTRMDTPSLTSYTRLVFSGFLLGSQPRGLYRASVQYSKSRSSHQQTLLRHEVVFSICLQIALPSLHRWVQTRVRHRRY